MLHLFNLTSYKEPCDFIDTCESILLMDSYVDLDKYNLDNYFLKHINIFDNINNRGHDGSTVLYLLTQLKLSFGNKLEKIE